APVAAVDVPERRVHALLRHRPDPDVVGVPAGPRGRRPLERRELGQRQRSHRVRGLPHVDTATKLATLTGAAPRAVTTSATRPSGGPLIARTRPVLVPSPCRTCVPTEISSPSAPATAPTRISATVMCYPPCWTDRRRRSVSTERPRLARPYSQSRLTASTSSALSPPKPTLSAE